MDFLGEVGRWALFCLPHWDPYPGLAIQPSLEVISVELWRLGGWLWRMKKGGPTDTFLSGTRCFHPLFSLSGDSCLRKQKEEFYPSLTHENLSLQHNGWMRHMQRWWGKAAAITSHLCASGVSKSDRIQLSFSTAVSSSFQTKREHLIVSALHDL